MLSNGLTTHLQVMVSTSGSHLLPKEAVQTLIQELLPVTTLLTPNLPEAKLLLQTAGVQFQVPEDVEGVIAIAKAIQKLGPKYVLLKGGHLPFTKEKTVAKTEEEQALVLNILYGGDKATVIESDYLQSRNTHGTGCSLACKLSVYWSTSSTANTNSCHCMQPCEGNGHG